MKLRSTLTACLMLLLTLGFGVFGQAKPVAGLDEQIKTEVASFKGKVFIFAKNLDTGETYALDADERVRTASTIKIAVMIEAFARVAEGKAKWTDELVLTKDSKVSGSGILTEFADGLHLTLRDGVNLMMLITRQRIWCWTF